MTDPIEQKAREAWDRSLADEADEPYWPTFLEGYRAAAEEMRDDPELDATDFAHPAWWRGEQAGVDGAVRNLERGIRGNGVCVHAGLQKQMERIARLEAERDEALEALRELREWVLRRLALAISPNSRSACSDGVDRIGVFSARGQLDEDHVPCRGALCSCKRQGSHVEGDFR